MKIKAKRILSIILALALIAGTAPPLVPQAQAAPYTSNTAGKYVPVYIGGDNGSQRKMVINGAITNSDNLPMKEYEPNNEGEYNLSVVDYEGKLNLSDEAKNTMQDVEGKLDPSEIEAYNMVSLFGKFEKNYANEGSNDVNNHSNGFYSDAVRLNTGVNTEARNFMLVNSGKLGVDWYKNEHGDGGRSDGVDYNVNFGIKDYEADGDNDPQLPEINDAMTPTDSVNNSEPSGWPERKKNNASYTYNYRYSFQISDNTSIPGFANLVSMAEAGNLEFYFSGLVGSAHQGQSGDDDHTVCQAWVIINEGDNERVVAYGCGGTETQSCHLGTISTGWQQLNPNDTVTIYLQFSKYNGLADHRNAGLCNCVLLFRDISEPTLTYKTDTHAETYGNELLMKLGTKNEDNPDDRYYNTAEYIEDKDNQSDAAVKSRDYVDVQFDFSEAVHLDGDDRNKNEELLTHNLFTNSLGTGYIGQGLNRGLVLYKSERDNGDISITRDYKYLKNDANNVIEKVDGVFPREDVLGGSLKSINYRYSAIRGDYSGNLPIPDGGGIEKGNALNNGVSLLDKIKNAGFHDAAGNPLIEVDGSKGTNILDKSDGGKDVIVDAEPPSYTRTGNGITPDILTDLVINKKSDSVDFIVLFSEPVITRRDLDDSKTCLVFDNGDKAYCTQKLDNGKRWVFTYDLKNRTADEVSLLKVIALTNDGLDSKLNDQTGGKNDNDSNYTFDVDARVITDYTGNYISDRVNRSGGDDQLESSISWAGLALDNTPPEIELSEVEYGNLTLAQNEDEWGEGAKVFVSATDADVPVGKYDPGYTDSNKEKPSKGIFRPGIGSGSTGSAVGLIFYIWTRSETPPDTGANYEAIKRFSLTGIQPGKSGESYTSDWSSQEDMLHMENNFANVTPFDDNIMSSENDGIWYLHVWTADMTWDSSRQRTQYELAKALEYNSANGIKSESDAVTHKMETIEKYRKDNTKQNGGEYTTPGFDEAWEAKKNDIYNYCYTPQFIEWLKTGGSGNIFSDDAKTYARTQTLLQVGNYDGWSMDKFRKEDSNWTQATRRLLFDSTLPEAVFDMENVSGNETANVTVPVTLKDTLSGIDTDSISYQWVTEGSEPNAPDWEPLKKEEIKDSTEGGNGSFMTGMASVVFSPGTDGMVTENGNYYLWLKYSDKAGNENVSQSPEVIAVLMEGGSVIDFGPQASVGEWSTAVIPEINVNGDNIGSVKYAVTDSPERPEDASFKEISPETGDDVSSLYKLPELSAENGFADGTWYVHILVTDDTEQKNTSHDYRAYKLDSTPPEVLMSPDSLDTPQLSVDVTVGINDELSGVNPGKCLYQFTLSEEEIGFEAEGWIGISNDEILTLQKESSGTYFLHVLAEDMCGNSIEKISKPFQIRGTDSIPMPAYGCTLLNIYEEDGAMYGIANVTLETEDKSGYRLSYSADGGETWCNWKPFMSMIRMDLNGEPVSNTLQVKFRSPEGVVGNPVIINPDVVYKAIWATAEFDSMKGRRTGPGNELTFIIEKPDDVVLKPLQSGVTALDNGNFSVSDNGVYEFSLMRGETPTTDNFIIVVDIFDNTPPKGYINYSTLVPVNGNVLASVNADEPFSVKEIITGDTKEEGKRAYTFEDNGSCVFVISDEAGNEANVTATVSNIDRIGPEVEIIRDYSGFGTKAYEGVIDNKLASGVKLTVIKKRGGSGEEFTVATEDKSDTILVSENGTYGFTVQDACGNTTTEEITLDNIVSSLPKYTVSYEYGSGAPVTEDSWKKDDVNITVKFEESPFGLALYGGIKIDEANRLENNTYSKTYSASGDTTLAVCDELGNIEKIPVSVAGIDREPPTLELNESSVALTLPAATAYVLSELTPEQLEMFGGYRVSDNICAEDKISVTVSRSDRKATISGQEGGQLTLVYTATDAAGNQTKAQQELILIPGEGLLITADGMLLSGSAANTAILPDNEVTFYVDRERMQNMFYRGEKVQNTSMRYDMYYVSGLYREGQMKYIAENISEEDLLSREYHVTFPKPGWYTIIIRNQERSREYTSFFVSSVK